MRRHRGFFVQATDSPTARGTPDVGFFLIFILSDFAKIYGPPQILKNIHLPPWLMASGT
jgi:hypothetical protein